ncbi:hypothetical protein RMR16_024745 (plasmid) [Agrobacterium sp. rho-13.3]|uniref:hypothetical protein n=1 Tax=Agrobacterium sp. rho-13.3 TaxID=3072980 RepID=UPI002A182E03|nr:hypothetical protein [Agrobacterium sp. rho-13.3]MDX8310161.1 hypothetical protein [Agrobacterium sp. rho-13.3]
MLHINFLLKADVANLVNAKMVPGTRYEIHLFAGNSGISEAALYSSHYGKKRGGAIPDNVAIRRFDHRLLHYSVMDLNSAASRKLHDAGFQGRQCQLSLPE